jgi:hypothetical protein
MAWAQIVKDDKKVICNLEFKKITTTILLFSSFNAHYLLPSLIAFCVVLCVCVISLQSLSFTFIVYPSSKTLGAQGLKFESSL